MTQEKTYFHETCHIRVASSLQHGIIVSFLIKQHLLELMTTKNDLRTCLISTIPDIQRLVNALTEKYGSHEGMTNASTKFKLPAY